MDFVLDLPQASSGEGFQISFEQMTFLGPGPPFAERESERAAKKLKAHRSRISSSRWESLPASSRLTSLELPVR